MGKVTLVLSDELEKEFRKAIYESKGMKRGNIQAAIEEAVQCWIDKQRQGLKE